MQIESGKFYRTRDGRKVGPIKRNGDVVSEARYWLADPGQLGPDSDTAWYADGAFYNIQTDPNDLVAEWSEGPVRTVTRKEIVEGVYGRLRVGSLVSGDQLTVGFADRTGIVPDDERRFFLTATELRAAAATLIEIADALEETA